ncbi:MAG: SAF domain-containing protein [Actinomycetaceae bacterium]|nr:SAF domain-containing protein [Actinomycetaceae bacterium]
MKEKLGAVGGAILAWRKPLLVALLAVTVFATIWSVLKPGGYTALVATSDIKAGEIIQVQAVTLDDQLVALPPDAAPQPALVVGKRAKVDILKGTIIRTAYTTEEQQSKEGRDTLALPVNPEVARLFAKGDTLDIYAPTYCPDEGEMCPAKLLTQGAHVHEVIITDESQWSSTQNAVLVIGIDPKHTSVVAGVLDSAALTLVKASQADESEGAASTD